jgi:FtsH-binding integral membrane protein
MFTPLKVPIKTKIVAFYATLAACLVVAIVNFAKAWGKHSVADAVAAALIWLVVCPVFAYFTMRDKPSGGNT